ncbi:hypothetical protein DFH07DRAFT_714530, partial [Mycena maculata]
IPDLLVLSVGIDNLRIEDQLNFRQPSGDVVLNIRGMVYHSQTGRHFTSITVDREGTLWYHDGIRTGRGCINMGTMKD